MRRPISRGSLDGAMAVATAVMLPLGLCVIVLGWYGAAHSPYLWEQVPYLISGGLLGLGLVMGAGLLYFGTWVARSAHTQRTSAVEMTALLQEIRDQLAMRPAAGPAPTNGHAAPSFVATARGSMWHRPDCTAVVGRADLRHVAAEAEGLRPCGLCNPLSVVPALVPRETT